MTANDMIIFGIKNCDKVRAAMKQAKDNGIDVKLHDFRVDGIDLIMVESMLKDIDLTQLLNKRSTTWKQLGKQLGDSNKVKVDAALLVEHPTLIKRPVVLVDGQYRIGL